MKKQQHSRSEQKIVKHTEPAAQTQENNMKAIIKHVSVEKHTEQQQVHAQDQKNEKFIYFACSANFELCSSAKLMLCRDIRVACDGVSCLQFFSFSARRCLFCISIALPALSRLCLPAVMFPCLFFLLFAWAYFVSVLLLSHRHRVCERVFVVSGQHRWPSISLLQVSAFVLLLFCFLCVCFGLSAFVCLFCVLFMVPVAWFRWLSLSTSVFSNRVPSLVFVGFRYRPRVFSLVSWRGSVGLILLPVAIDRVSFSLVPVAWFRCS